MCLKLAKNSKKIVTQKILQQIHLENSELQIPKSRILQLFQRIDIYIMNVFNSYHIKYSPILPKKGLESNSISMNHPSYFKKFEF